MTDVYGNLTWQVNRLSARTTCINTRVPSKEKLLDVTPCQVAEQMLCPIHCNLTEYDRAVLEVFDTADTTGSVVLSRHTVDLTTHNQEILVPVERPKQNLSEVLMPNVIPIKNLTLTALPNQNSSGSKLAQLLQKIGKYDYVSELLSNKSGLAQAHSSAGRTPALSGTLAEGMDCAAVLRRLNASSNVTSSPDDGMGCWIIRLVGGTVKEMSESLEQQLPDEWVVHEVPPRDHRYGYKSLNNSESIKSFRNARKKLWLVPAGLNATEQDSIEATSRNETVPTSNLTAYLLSSLRHSNLSLIQLYSGYMP